MLGENFICTCHGHLCSQNKMEGVIVHRKVSVTTSMSLPAGGKLWVSVCPATVRPKQPKTTGLSLNGMKDSVIPWESMRPFCVSSEVHSFWLDTLELLQPAKQRHPSITNAFIYFSLSKCAYFVDLLISSCFVVAFALFIIRVAIITIGLLVKKIKGRLASQPLVLLYV